MRHLVISDIHANLTAFEVVLQDAGELHRDFDFVWCLGDLVGYGPDPNECCELLRQFPNACLAGNHDWAALGRLDLRTFNAEARKAVGWTRDALSRENREYLESLPTTLILGDYTLAHGSPREPVWEYILDVYVAAANFSHFDTPYCLVGHTHTPITYQRADDDEITPIRPVYGEPIHLDNGHRQIINPGSIGQPRDNDPRAAYAILDVENHVWEYRRVAYPIEDVQARMRDIDMPERLVARLEHGW